MPDWLGEGPAPLFEPDPPVTPDLLGNEPTPLFEADPPVTPDLLGEEPTPLFEADPPVTPDRLADEPVTLDLLPAPDRPGDGGIKSSSSTDALGTSNSVWHFGHSILRPAAVSLTL